VQLQAGDPVNDANSMAGGDPLDTQSSTQSTDGAGASSFQYDLRRAALDKLPFEPAFEEGGPGGADEAEPSAESSDSLARLRDFYLYGRRPAEESMQHQGPILPALLYPYRDLSRVRHDFPACLNVIGQASAFCSLTEIIEEVIASLADDSESGQQLKSHLYRLESEIRSRIQGSSVTGLFDCWDSAAEKLVQSSQLSEDKINRLRENLELGRQALADDCELLACQDAAPRRLLAAAVSFHWTKRCAAWCSELDALIQQLQDILTIDFNRSEEAKTAEHLRESTGTPNEDFNFQAMSSILTSAQHDQALPKERSGRIRKALSILLCMRPVFDPSAGRNRDDPPVDAQTIVEDCAAAVQEHDSRMRSMVDFFRSVRIARLEVDNRYRETAHDEYFENFDASQLTDDELFLCPPVFLNLKSGSVTKAELGELLDILNSGLPIKVLIQLDEIYDSDDKAGCSAITFGWAARVANMAMALTHVYVSQSPLSGLSQLHRGLMEGLDYEGPALFTIYAGNRKNRPFSSSYLDSAAAVESRSFPVFSFNPGKGETLAQRSDVSANPQCEEIWPSEPFTYLGADGNETQAVLAFTPADFLLADRRFGSHFWRVPQEYWHENMQLLHLYVQQDLEAEPRFPYLLTVDEEGRVGRTLVTRFVVAAVLRCACLWRNLQELGGINNSFALNAIAQEIAHLEAEQHRALERIEQEYNALLDQNIGKLTEQIVQRIAASLTRAGASNLEPGPFAVPAGASEARSVPTAPPAPAETEAETSEDEQEAEEEIAAFDDAYIDTPLCTTCNECTDLNGQLFAYDENKQAFIKDPAAGPFKDLVRAAELCPVRIIHPGKPKDPSEPGLEDLVKRAAVFN